MKATNLALLLGLVLSAACTSAAVPHPSPSPVSVGGRAQGANEREIIRRASMEMEARRPAEAARRVDAITRGAGGRVEESIDREEKRVTMVLRVPAAALDAVLDSVARLGKVKDRQVGALDVTEQTADLQARLQNQMAVRNRLRQHLQRAGAVQDVIAVERELARVQTDIDLLEGQLRALRSNVAMSRVELDIHRPRVLGPLGLIVAGVARVIGKLFVIQ